MPLASGTRVGSYTIVELIGAGGMGEVYRAHDARLNRDVALKVLPAGLAADPDRQSRFAREAQVLASLNHPHIAAIYGLEEFGDSYALVLELVDGVTLAERIAEGPVPLRDALAIAAQIAQALDAAGGRGVTHRDLKPGNIKLRADGTVKVLDFGLAKLAHTEATAPKPDAVTQTSVGATRIGSLVGTPAYMSPEQARGYAVGTPTDIWALGCVLYEMLAGRPAFGADTPSDSIARILEREPDWHALPPSTPAVVHRLLRACLEKDVHRRVQGAAAVRAEIEAATRALERPFSGSWRPAVLALAAIATVVMMAIAWRTWPRAPTPASLTNPLAPISIIIADFTNATGDPDFDRTLEPLLSLVLEGASFVSAYDRNAIGRSLGVRPPDVLDEPTARNIAVKQGLVAVLTGAVDNRNGTFPIQMRISNATSGQSIVDVEATAETKEGVLAVAMELAARLRTALGDKTPTSSSRLDVGALSRSSLEAVRHYAVAMDALSRSEFDQALRAFASAVAVDSSFGLAHGGMAIASRNMGRQQDAERYIREATKHVDSMTPRERYRTRGLFYFITSDYQQCVSEYTELVGRYPTDVAGRNNLALCLSYLRKLSGAMEEMRRVVQMLPNRSLYRVNLSVYSTYSGDFASGEREARAILEQSPWGPQALALAQTGQGAIAAAADSYRQLGKTAGPSCATSGLADLAAYEGRYADAIGLLRDGAAADLKEKELDRASLKFAALALAETGRARPEAARAAVEEALAYGKSITVRFLAARSLVEIGETSRAVEVASTLATELTAEPQVYAKILEGGAARRQGNFRAAISRLLEANALLDTWIGHFELGRAYLETKAYVQADAEFDRCIRRHGEALSLFMDEEPTAVMFPPVLYLQGLARDGMKAGGASESFQAYLRIRGNSTEDATAAHVREWLSRAR